MDYANGAWVSYGYDILGRVIQKYYSDDRTVDYFYDNNGQICSVKDSVNGNIYYTYDRLGRLVYYRNEASEVCCGYTYDSNGRLIYTDYQLDGFDRGSERYSYNSNKTDGISDGILTGMQLATSYGLGREYDYLQRLVKRTMLSLTENYTYAAGEGENSTTTLVSGKTNTLGGTVVSDYQYTYDANGNIRVVIDNADGGEGIAYTYDELNQLTGVSYRSGGIERYTYDAYGNLLTFNNGISSHTYTYGNSDWKDLLTAVDGVPFFYDELGNPLSYYNGQSYSLSWTEGRKLATITTDGKTTSYLYDTDGIRVRKTNADGSYIIYVIANGTALGEKHYSAEDELVKTLRYTYDENGTVCGYVSNSADGAGTYCFIKNLQGDVTHVYRVSDKAIVATYTYNSWGNIISATGEKAEENPFRYRGYYYDVESGFYATGSRYYDPEIGRFINEDSLIAQSSVLGNNMFAYCLNNPVNMTDTTGNLPFFAITAAIGAVAGAVIGGVTAAKNDGNILAGIGIGAVAGGLVGAGLGTLAGAALGGSVMATTTQVAIGAGQLATTVATGGLGAGAIYISNNFQQAANDLTQTASVGADPIKNALKQLDTSGLRPGQTEVSRSKIMELVNNFNPAKAQSSVNSIGGTRYLVDGHHTTIASTILGKGNCMNMGVFSNQLPSATNIYWTKHWYEFWKTAIKIME